MPWNEGVSGNLQEVGVGAAMPAHSIARPTALGIYGSFRVSSKFPLDASMSTNTQLLQLRWTDIGRLALITYFRLQVQGLALANTGENFRFEAYKALNASAGGGGALLVPSSMRSSMRSSLAGAIRFNIGADLVAMTTLDPEPFCVSTSLKQRTNPAPGTEEETLKDPTLTFKVNMASGEYPLVLAQNEGLVVKYNALSVVPGTAIVQLEMAWMETTDF